MSHVANKLRTKNYAKVFTDTVLSHLHFTCVKIMTEGLFEISLSFYINTLNYKNKKFHIRLDIFVISPRILLINNRDDPFRSVILHGFYHFIKKVSKGNSTSTSRICKFLMDRHLRPFLSPQVPSKMPCKNIH